MMAASVRDNSSQAVSFQSCGQSVGEQPRRGWVRSRGNLVIVHRPVLLPFPLFLFSQFYGFFTETLPHAHENP